MENNKRPAQAMMALQYMRENGSITSLEALKDLGIMSFPKRVCELEKMGYLVKRKTETVVNRFGKKVSVKRYSLIEEPTEDDNAV
jgi:hypothetical protein